jgi:hypothetical protein
VPYVGVLLTSGVLERVHLGGRQRELVHGEIIGHVLGIGCAGECDHSQLECKTKDHLRRGPLVAAGDVVNE